VPVKVDGTDYNTAWKDAVLTDPGTTGGTKITNVITLSQALYDAIATKSATTLYVVV
jgi:hypothetical protein